MRWRYLACSERATPQAPRIARCADGAHEAHGQVVRRPTEDRLRRAAAALLAEHLGPLWRDAAGVQPVDEVEACALALGLRA